MKRWARYFRHFLCWSVCMGVGMVGDLSRCVRELTSATIASAVTRAWWPSLTFSCKHTLFLTPCLLETHINELCWLQWIPGSSSSQDWMGILLLWPRKWAWEWFPQHSCGELWNYKEKNLMRKSDGFCMHFVKIQSYLILFNISLVSPTLEWVFMRLLSCLLLSSAKDPILC